MSSEVIEVAREIQIQNILVAIANGTPKVAACKAGGLDIATFNKWIARSPELIQEVRSISRTKFLDSIDAIEESRLKNLGAKLTFLDELREVINDPNAEFERRKKAYQLLLRGDKDLREAMDLILPVVKETGPSGPPKMEADIAQDFLKQLSEGANLVRVTKTTTVEVGQAGAEIIEGTVSNPAS
jgi:hypothetical protein